MGATPKISTVRQKIKEFCRYQPSNSGPNDYTYKLYLVKCASLLQLDNRLTIIENTQDLDNEETKRNIRNIAQKVNRIVRYELTKNLY